MKFKNFHSAIHNFAHSFQSIDFRISGILAINILIRLNKQNVETSTTFDFIAQTIIPKEADTKESRQLLNNYLSWLPEHLSNHNCDLAALEKLEITLNVDFNKAFTPYNMENCKEIKINTLVKWKVKDRDERIINISQVDVFSDEVLMNGLLEFFPKANSV